MPSERRPTSHDVARCRRCIEGDSELCPQRRDQISASLRKCNSRVSKAVEDLQYTPHHHARMLKVHESDMVLIVMFGATPGPC